MLFHAGLDRFEGGFIGVDVFFVLSGFLVGSVVLNEFAATGRIRLIPFYARRVRRLLPAAVITVVGVSAMTVLVQPRLTREGFIDDAQSSLLYVANWHFLADATDYFAADVSRSPFLHFWSLAIEEQFYIVFPLLVLGLLLAAKRARRPLLVPLGLAVGLVLSLVAQFVYSADDPLRAYYGTDTRFYQLLAGTTLAAVVHQRGIRRPAPLPGRPSSVRWAAWCATAAGLVLVLAASSSFSVDPTWRGVAATALSVALIVALEIAPRAPIGRFLSSSPMTYLGRISYSTYLWHWPLIVLAVPVLNLTPWQRAALSGVGATALAALSFQLIESPIRASRFVLRRPRPIIAAGLAVSVLAAVVIVPQLLESRRRPALVRAPALAAAAPISDEQAAELERLLIGPPPTEIDVQQITIADIDQSGCTAGNPDGCVLHRGGGLDVMLLGDSNAEMLISAFTRLAEKHDFTLSVSTVVGCPWQEGLLWQADDQRLLDNCLSGRAAWYDDIVPALEPDIIVVANVPRDPGSRRDAFFEPQNGALGERSLNEVIAAATADSLDRLTDAGSRVVILEPLPYANFNPTECLSGAITVADCSYQTPTVPYPTESIYRNEALGNSEVFSVDYDRIACPYLPTCVPIIEGNLVFRNEFHLSQRWIDLHSDQLWSTLAGAGAIPA